MRRITAETHNTARVIHSTEEVECVNEPFRNECMSSADCDDPTVRMSGVTLTNQFFYCKAKYNEDDCCSIEAEESNAEMCEAGTKCSTGESGDDGNDIYSHV
jgi:hypothetical protein